MSVRALVPLKRLADAKTRLLGVLPDEERRRLVVAMAEHVLAVAREAADEVFLIAPEPIEALAWPRLIADPVGELNGALAHALARLDGRAGDIVLVILADLPLLTPADLAALIAAADEGLAIAPDRLDVGVNAVAFRLPLDLRFRFGPDSRRLFEAEAARLGVPCAPVRRPGLGLDIDDAESLALYAEQHYGDIA